MISSEKQAMQAPCRRISVRRNSDRQAYVSRGGFLPPNHEEEDENSFISGDDPVSTSTAHGPERLQSGGSMRRNSNSHLGESEVGSALSNPLGSRRVTEDSGCGTTPNSSATLGHMSGYRGPVGTLSAPESVARGSGDSDTCTGASHLSGAFSQNTLFSMHALIPNLIYEQSMKWWRRLLSLDSSLVFHCRYYRRCRFRKPGAITSPACAETLALSRR